MGRTQEPGGDYGYDLVHEEVPTRSAPPADGYDAPPPAVPDDGVGDHGYDEAHDF